MYIFMHQVHILHLKETIVNSIVSETLLKNMCEDCNVDDVLYFSQIMFSIVRKKET